MNWSLITPQKITCNKCFLQLSTQSSPPRTYGSNCTGLACEECSGGNHKHSKQTGNDKKILPYAFTRIWRCWTSWLGAFVKLANTALHCWNNRWWSCRSRKMFFRGSRYSRECPTTSRSWKGNDLIRGRTNSSRFSSKVTGLFKQLTTCNIDEILRMLNQVCLRGSCLMQNTRSNFLSES